MTNTEIATKPKPDRTRKLETLPPHIRLSLMRRIAGGETQAALAVEFGCTPQSVSQFKQRHADQISEMAADLDNKFAGLWIARKENRLDAIEQVIRDIEEHPNAKHHEWLKTKLIALRNAAEELGQLPPKQVTTVIPVMHVVQGVNLDDAFGE